MGLCAPRCLRYCSSPPTKCLLKHAGKGIPLVNLNKKCLSALLLLFSFNTHAATNVGSVLMPGSKLNKDQFMQSSTGSYTLHMQTDGSLVMYRRNGTVRYSFAKLGLYAVMQQDCNFVEYNSSNNPIWNSATYGQGVRCQLSIYDDGELRIEEDSFGVCCGLRYRTVWTIGPDPTPPIIGVRYPMVSTPPPGNPPPNLPYVPSLVLYIYGY